MTLVLDAGGLLALERGDRAQWRRLKQSTDAGIPAVTHGGVVAQVWRGGSGRQALLAQAMASIEVTPLDADLGRRAGVLLGKAGMADAVDAALVALCQAADHVVTSDPADIRRLAEAAKLHFQIVPC